MSETREQTFTSFKDKWENNKSEFFADLLNPESEITQWLLQRNGFNSFAELGVFLKKQRRVLDAGCGNGRVTNLFASLTPSTIVAGDLSSFKVAEKNLENYPNVKVVQINLLNDLSELGKFDFIYCQEVLHHTGNPTLAFSNLTRLLADSGEIAIYVYKKKAPVREFVDDYVREKIKDLDYEQATKVCEAITLLGKTLTEKNISIQVPEIAQLGIKAGEYPLQRFIYHHFMKCFWNPGLTLKENITINYDWYHPSECSRHTIEEVRGWFTAEQLLVTKEHADEYGITMWGRKQ